MCLIIIPKNYAIMSKNLSTPPEIQKFNQKPTHESLKCLHGFYVELNSVLFLE